VSSLDPAIALLEATLNRYLRLDPEGFDALAPLHGRVIGVEVLGPNLRLTFVPSPNGLQVLSHYEGEPDCLLRGTPWALARLGLGGKREQTLFAGEVTIEGNTETAQRFGALWAGLDVDWEEQLSRLTGDPLAHQAGRLVRGLRGWARAAAGSLTADLQEYLQEEARLLPTRIEVGDFADEVDRLRDDVERLAARLKRVERPRMDSAPDSDQG